jgi:hypothetical protein
MVVGQSNAVHTSRVKFWQEKKMGNVLYRDGSEGVEK